MSQPQRKAILQQWRTSSSNSGPRFLVLFDVVIKPPELPFSPLVINFDLPRSVESYAHRAAAAVPPKNGNGLPGVIVSFVQAAGGDVEMLRSTECAYRFKVCLLSNEMWCEADDSLRRYLLYSMIYSIIDRSQRA
jgi:translation initiation factor 4A